MGKVLFCLGSKPSIRNVISISSHTVSAKSKALGSSAGRQFDKSQQHFLASFAAQLPEWSHVADVPDHRAFNKVVLPAPLRPNKATISPDRESS